MPELLPCRRGYRIFRRRRPPHRCSPPHETVLTSAAAREWIFFFPRGGWPGGEGDRADMTPRCDRARGARRAGLAQVELLGDAQSIPLPPKRRRRQQWRSQSHSQQSRGILGNRLRCDPEACYSPTSWWKKSFPRDTATLICGRAESPAPATELIHLLGEGFEAVVTDCFDCFRGTRRKEPREVREGESLRSQVGFLPRTHGARPSTVETVGLSC
jgi:hypothetical protein